MADLTDEQVLADLRTLNRWADDIPSRFWTVKTVNEQPCCCLFAPDFRELAACVRVGQTQELAMHHAAQWIREQRKEGAGG